MRRLLVLTGLVILVGGLFGDVAFGGRRETEIRLTQAGVAPELRRRVVESIDRAVAYLLGQQGPDGRFSEGPYSRWYSDVGSSLLAGLALRAADTDAGNRAADRVIAGLTDAKGRIADEVRDEVYLSGIALMMSVAGRGGVDVDSTLARSLTESLDPASGWWGYKTTREPAQPGGVGTNLSTSQFGALGLWAARRLSLPVPSEVWRRHLCALLAEQRGDGSWPYEAGTSVGHPGYPAGTSMGYANVVLAASALSKQLAEDPGLSLRVAAACRQGRRALDRDVPLTLDWVTRISRPVHWRAYALFALEKAAVFARMEVVGGRRWYQEGAEFLMERQRETGGWNLSVTRSETRVPENVVDTSFALLFLLRDAQSYRPDPPPVVPTPGVATTLGPDAPPPPPGPGPSPVDPGTVRAVVEELEDLLARPGPHAEAILDGLEILDSLLPRLRLDESDASANEEAGRLRSSVDDVLVRALGSTRLSRNRSRNLRCEGNRCAARMLRKADPRVVPRLLSTLESTFLRARFHVAEAFWYDAFSTLLALAPEEGIEWLRHHALSADVDARSVSITRAALDAIAAGRRLSGPARYATARILITRFGRLERLGEWRIENGGHDFGPFRSRLRCSVLLALDRLARDPASGAVPRVAGGNRLGSVAAWSSWLRSHSDSSLPPWSE